jgi:hypothetical protein
LAQNRVQLVRPTAGRDAILSTDSHCPRPPAAIGFKLLRKRNSVTFSDSAKPARRAESIRKLISFFGCNALLVVQLHVAAQQTGEAILQTQAIDATMSRLQQGAHP